MILLLTKEMEFPVVLLADRIWEEGVWREKGNPGNELLQKHKT